MSYGIGFCDDLEIQVLWSTFSIFLQIVDVFDEEVTSVYLVEKRSDLEFHLEDGLALAIHF